MVTRNTDEPMGDLLPQGLFRKPDKGAVLLLSDLHLDILPPEKITRLASVVRKDFKEAQAIVIVGDIADNPADPTVRADLEKHAGPFLKSLQAHADKGTPIHYIPGNHDEDFRTQTMNWDAFPVTSYGGQHPVELNFFDKRLRFTHGDELDPLQTSGDVGEGIMSAARSDLLKGVTQAFFNAEHKFFRAQGRLARLVYPFTPRTGEYMEWMSRMTEIPMPNPMSFYWIWNQEARRLVRTEGWDAVIMGHTHAPTVVDFGKGLYINTGDWMQHAVVTWLEEWGVFQQDFTRHVVYKSEPWVA